MRITLGMLTSKIRTDLMQGAERLVDAQQRASSGKRILRPSDDVPGVGRMLSLKSALASIEQYDRNSSVAGNLLSITNDALNSVVNKIQDVRKLALQAASANVNQQAREGIAAQLDQITIELQSTANTKYLDKYIFSGSMSGSEAIVENGAGTPPYLFQGDDAAFEIQIAPGTFIAANVTADMVFNMNGVAKPGVDDIFSTLKTLRDQVVAGDITAISNQVAEIDAHLTNVIAIRSQVGGRLGRLESANQTLEDSRLKVLDLLSKTEDADTADAIIDLQTRQNVYQAAVSVASRILDLSLTNVWR